LPHTEHLNVEPAGGVAWKRICAKVETKVPATGGCGATAAAVEEPYARPSEVEVCDDDPPAASCIHERGRRQRVQLRRILLLERQCREYVLVTSTVMNREHFSIQEANYVRGRHTSAGRGEPAAREHVLPPVFFDGRSNDECSRIARMWDNIRDAAAVHAST
jgi:hypothetical protein